MVTKKQQASNSTFIYIYIYKNTKELGEVFLSSISFPLKVTHGPLRAIGRPLAFALVSFSFAAEVSTANCQNGEETICLLNMHGDPYRLYWRMPKNVLRTWYQRGPDAWPCFALHRQAARGSVRPGHVRGRL